MAMLIALLLLQAGAWLYINKAEAGRLFSVISASAFILAAVISVYVYGVEAGITLAILLAGMLLFVNVLIKPVAKK
jgi:hypothetical protein